ncbi:MAG: glycosyltransferase [Polyangiaceae bacterium]
MIPASAHFIWIGSEFPWLNWAALASAQRNGGFSRVQLHHTHDLSGMPWFRQLRQAPRVECQRLDVDAELEQAAGARLVDRYRALSAPAAQANVLRVALLLNHGGVYLDLDTVTTQSLTPLREESAFFCGAERLAFPAALSRSRSPSAWAAAYLRSAARDIARRSSHGVRWFERIGHWYPTAANNAVLGAAAQHPFLHELCARMLALSPSESRRRYALGTSLLQHALAENRAKLSVHPPEVFYPLGPELSEHWFRLDTAATLDDVLAPTTRVVHWYASVRTRRAAPLVEPKWVQRKAQHQLLSALLQRALGESLGQE